MDPALLPVLSAEPQLGRAHFAYLRAVAEGISIDEAAKRYLGITHGKAAAAAHRHAVECARAVARRRGDRRWRLIGLRLSPSPGNVLPPPIDQWADAEGLAEWSHDELQSLYAERFGAPPAGTRRRQLRTDRLRAQQLALLDELETSAVEHAMPSDRLDAWLEPRLAAKLQKHGLLLLADLQRAIAAGGRWWRFLGKGGPQKAKRLAQTVESLLGSCSVPQWNAVVDEPPAADLSGAHGANRVKDGPGRIDATEDRSAIQSWIAARAASPYTAQQYQREAERFLLFCIVQRRRALSDATADDCRAYLDFLSDIPPDWISRHKVPRLAPGWAPFKGPLSPASQRLAVAILRAMFDWLVAARYLASNPWALVNHKRVAGSTHKLLYRITDEGVEVGRLLHEDMSVAQHLPVEWLIELMHQSAA